MRVNAGLPTTALAGDREVRDGTGLGMGLMVKLNAADVPPPRAGLSTETLALPGELTSVARICAESEVPETKAVARVLPFHRTCEPETKPEPFTVRVKAGASATTLEGDRDLSVGAGLGTGLMVKLSAAEVPPPGAAVLTVTLAVPVLLRSEAGTWACRLVAELNVVVRATPFHSMTDAGTRPLPEATMVRAEAPAVLVLGLIPLSVGAGF